MSSTATDSIESAAPTRVEHTATPWQLADDPTKIVGAGSYRGKPAPYMITIAETVGYKSPREANAALIVEAVNSHASLVAEVGRLRGALEGLFEHCVMMRKHWGDSNNSRAAANAIEQARAALANTSQSGG